VPVFAAQVVGAFGHVHGAAAACSGQVTQAAVLATRLLGEHPHS
jgi:hypothetical protein